MPRSPKSEVSLGTVEVKRRVGRACQRCRLKKCKCDGATPCTRCKSDDAICTFEKHKKSNKTVFRSGYVQMLERQHGQLSAGLQELYRRAQSCGSWTGPCLEFGDHDQPLTHEILEVLGVLHSDDGEDMESVNHDWQDLEAQDQDGNDWMYSRMDSSPTQAAFSPNSTPQMAFSQSAIMSKRQSKAHSSLAPTAQTLSMPPPLIASSACIKPEPYIQAFPIQIPTFTDTFPLADTFPLSEQMSMSLDQVSGSTTDWSFGMDDLFGNFSGQDQLANAC